MPIREGSLPLAKIQFTNNNRTIDQVSSDIDMNFTALLVLFVSLGAAVAGNSLRGADKRDLATAAKMAICSKLSAGVYVTKYVNQTAAIPPGSFKGACSKICYSICAEFASFAVSGGKCTCLAGVVATKSPTKASTKAPTKPSSKAPTKAPTKMPTNSPTKMPTKTPTKAPTKQPAQPAPEVNPCDKFLCASNQICSNTAESFTCEPIMCANPYGNPCGPGRACKDTPTGFTCQSLYGSDICPVGCGPDSTCVQGKCECNQGFYRPKPYLGCVAVR
jgi:hypothetical protein